MNGLAGTAFQFVREGNRHGEVRRGLSVRENLGLGQLGLTRGGVSAIKGALGGFPSVSIGGSSSARSILLWVVVAFVLLKVVK